MPRPKQSETSKTNLVAPVESVEASPGVQSQEIITQIEKEPELVTDPCWNCGKQLKDNVCSDCKFDKSLIHNLELEAERATAIQQQLNK